MSDAFGVKNARRGVPKNSVLHPSGTVGFTVRLVRFDSQLMTNLHPNYSSTRSLTALDGDDAEESCVTAAALPTLASAEFPTLFCRFRLRGSDCGLAHFDIAFTPVFMEGIFTGLTSRLRGKPNYEKIKEAQPFGESKKEVEN
jgi:hypothetical protein